MASRGVQVPLLVPNQKNSLTATRSEREGSHVGPHPRFCLLVQDPDHCIPGLLSILLDRLTSPKYAPISRSSACAYLASFLARAAYIPEATVVESLQVLKFFNVTTLANGVFNRLISLPSSELAVLCSGGSCNLYRAGRDLIRAHVGFVAVCQPRWDIRIYSRAAEALRSCDDSSCRRLCKKGASENVMP